MPAGLLAAALLAIPVALLQAERGEDAPNNDPIFRVRQAQSHVRIIERFARVFEMKSAIRTVDGFDPEIVAVTTIGDSAYRIRVQALKSGVTTMILTDENGQTWEIEILVGGDTRHLQAVINKLFPHAAIEAVDVNGSVVLRGWVTQPEHINEIVDVAERFFPEVLNQMRVGGVQQVLLKCKVLEVQRSKIQRLGINFAFLRGDKYLVSTPGSLTPLTQLSAPFGGPPGITVSGFPESTLTFGLIRNEWIFQGFIQALRDEGLLKIHAEPSLVTTNGHPASLLNGGEFPIIVPAGLGTVAIDWREFGVRLQAVPLILGGGRLRLQLEPEVSERDFANQVSINGVTVPALTVRRAVTQVEMNFGDTLAIAGLISTRNTSSANKVPLLGEIPVLGAAFSRKSMEESETELVIVVTPEYVSPIKENQYPPGAPGQFTDSPTTRELFLHNMLEVPKYGDEYDTCPPGAQQMISPGGYGPYSGGTMSPGGPGMIQQGPVHSGSVYSPGGPNTMYVPPDPQYQSVPAGTPVAPDAGAAPVEPGSATPSTTGPNVPPTPISSTRDRSRPARTRSASLFGSFRRKPSKIRRASAEQAESDTKEPNRTIPSKRRRSTPGLISPKP